MKIIVEGSRGKSGIVEVLTNELNKREVKTLGKVSGKSTTVFTEDGEYDIERKGNRFFIEDENLNVLKRHPEYEVYIFENQALSDYTMNLFHKVIKPEIVIVPNIRFEHQNSLGLTIISQAKSFASNWKGVKKVITTEPKKEVLDIFQKYCDKFGVELIILEPEKFPGEQVRSIVSYVVGNVFSLEWHEHHDRNMELHLLNRLKIKYSESLKINYFLGAKVNDIESTTNVFNHLKQDTNKNFVFVCYLRLDRNERSHAFRSFFEKYGDDERIERIYFFGHKISIMAKNERVFRIAEDSVDEIIDYCRENDCILFTAINGVVLFMQNLEKRLVF